MGNEFKYIVKLKTEFVIQLKLVNVVNEKYEYVKCKIKYVKLKF